MMDIFRRIFGRRPEEKREEHQQRESPRSTSVAGRSSGSSPLAQSLEHAYRTSGLQCAFCGKPLRKPLGGLVTTSGDMMEALLEGIPYYCLNCRTTSCFDCCADSKVMKVLCRNCGSEMTAWGQVEEARRAQVAETERRATESGTCIICRKSTRLVGSGLCSRCYEASKRAVDYLKSHERSGGICDWCCADLEAKIGDAFMNDSNSKIECRQCAMNDMEKYGKFV